MNNTKLNKDFHQPQINGEVILTHARKGKFSGDLGGRIHLKVFESVLQNLGIQPDMDRQQIVGCLNDLMSPDNEDAAAVVDREVDMLVKNKAIAQSQMQMERNRLFTEMRGCFNGFLSRIKEFCESEIEM